MRLQLGSFLAAACLFVLVLGAANRAEASHFRYGSINWTVPDPIGAPRTVRFTVSVAWRSTFIDTTTLDFGDGTNNGAVTGTVIGTGTDASGNAYTVLQYTATHTYATAGTFTAFFTSCCRVGGLQNGADSDFRVETRVSLVAGNTEGPVTSAPAIIQLQFGAIRTYTFPMVDSDGDPLSCRFATAAETGLPVGQVIPRVPAGGAVPTLSSGPLGCTVTWDLAMAATGQQFVLHIVMESTHGGVISSAAIDLIVEIVTPPPPTCAGSGVFIANVGSLFSTTTTGTWTTAPPATVTSVGAPVGSTLTPVTGASPLTTTFRWTPLVTDAGTTRIVLVNYTSASLSGTCFITLEVPECVGFGVACSAGVGACSRTGTQVCAGPGVTVCNAIPGAPVAELCDGLDNDCNGVVDNGNPGSGPNCSTGLPGLCDHGHLNCIAGGLACIGDDLPGTVPEVCDGFDNDCDGVVDNGFNVGMTCSAGVGACAQSGVFVCGGASTLCNAVPGAPAAELCDALDNDCDGVVDNGNPESGAGCSTGLMGVCGVGATDCGAGGVLGCLTLVTPGTVTETCNGADDNCDGVVDEMGAECAAPTAVCGGVLGCVECVAASDCDDTVECSVDSCAANACVHAASPAETTCSGGLCDGTIAPTSCTVCLDSTSGGVDAGCTSSAPACLVGAGGAASVCAACEDTEMLPTPDNGCGASAPICDLGGASPMCVECLGNADCATGTICGPASTCVPGCATDLDCAATPTTAFCDVTNMACVECTMTSQCNGDQVCVTDTGTCEQPDTDGDGIPNDLDLDDDNDGIPDSAELGGTDLSIDTDGDGIPDYADADSGCTDADGDGRCDMLSMEVDFDGDGIPNHLDLDSDGDGIPDLIEGGGVDADGNGRVDGFVDADGNGLHDPYMASPLPLPNTDGAAGPDFLDLDSDGDGVPDATEGHDANHDGRADRTATGNDTDGDGIDDAFDVDCTAATCAGTVGVRAPLPDTDGDGAPDYADADDDGDGVLTADEDTNSNGNFADDDLDGDGIPDYLDPTDDRGRDAGVRDGGVGDGGADAGPETLGGLAGGACGCAVAGAPTSTSAAPWLLAMLGLSLAARRRRRSLTR